MTTTSAIPINCDLATSRGDESTDIVVFQLDNALIYILATTAPNEITISFSPKTKVDDLNQWPSQIPIDIAKEIVIWAVKYVKDAHIRSRCVIGAEYEHIRELILSVASVAFIHPSAIYNSHTKVVPASFGIVDHDASKRGRLRMHLCANCPPAGIIRGDQLIDHLQRRMASIVVWTCPISNDDVLRIPYPSITNKTMNSTVITLGPLVRSSAVSRFVYNVDIKEKATCKILQDMELREATLAYVAENTLKDMPNGLHYPHLNFKDVSNGRLFLQLSGTRAEDATAIGLVRFVEYNDIGIPIVNGCVVRDCIRFEKAHIPIVFSPIRPQNFRFEDMRDGKILMLEGDNIWGKIDVVQKEIHNGVWWVWLTKI